MILKANQNLYNFHYIWTCIFSSPDPVRFSEIMKNEPNARFTMSTWTEQELMFVNPDIERWDNDFVLFGGVPR